MRRKDREITDKSQIKEFISSEQILRIGFYDKDEVYIVPVNYGFVFEDEKYNKKIFNLIFNFFMWQIMQA